jgi:hypothetical protein
VGSSNTILHFDGKEWNSANASSATDTNPSFTAVWGTAPDNVYAVGYHSDDQEGRVMRFDGVAWKQVHAVSNISLQAVGGTAASDVYAVGASGAVRYYDGTSWSSQSSFNRTLSGVWSFGTEAYAVGEAGMVLHRKKP